MFREYIDTIYSLCFFVWIDKLFLRSNPQQIGPIQYQGEIWIFDVKLGWTWVFMSDLIKCVISEIKLDPNLWNRN